MTWNHQRHQDGSPPIRLIMLKNLDKESLDNMKYDFPVLTQFKQSSRKPLFSMSIDHSHKKGIQHNDNLNHSLKILRKGNW